MGELYTLYQGRPLSRQGIIYRKDWAENLGLEAPTTTDEFMEMVRAFTEDDPDGNGKDDTFGLTDRSDLIYGAFKTVSSWFGTPNYWGEKRMVSYYQNLCLMNMYKQWTSLKKCMRTDTLIKTFL
ncbi:hypothetical protein [Gracilibacillus sp. JCM 18860]|uniref:hypothetical protein n=1 Tax=Gracilibacillus sp. JCM 18860 TaxID=1306159 RepID=UPI003261D310